MMTLDDAWNWYLKTRNHVQLFGRFGQKHWDALPWEGQLGKDEKLKGVESGTIVTDATFCLEHLNDFAVLILFSVFESAVRDNLLSDVQIERARLSHALVIRLMDDAVQDIEHGSFFRVLEFFKGRDAELVEQVNQVRKYRNWVAHGRRTARPDAVDPETAFRRLKQFLGILTGPEPQGEDSAE